MGKTIDSGNTWSVRAMCFYILTMAILDVVLFFILRHFWPVVFSKVTIFEVGTIASLAALLWALHIKIPVHQDLLWYDFCDPAILTSLVFIGPFKTWLAFTLGTMVYLPFVPKREMITRAKLIGITMNPLTYGISFIIINLIRPLESQHPFILGFEFMLLLLIQTGLDTAVISKYYAILDNASWYKSAKDGFAWEKLAIRCYSIPAFSAIALLAVYMWLEGDYAAPFLLLMVPLLLIRWGLQNSQNLQTWLYAVSSTMGAALDARDPYTKWHSKRVTEYALLIAKEADYDEIKSDKLKKEAELHDIGKLFVPDEVLQKPDKLTDEEYNKIKLHTHLDSILLRYLPKDFLVWQWADIGRHHHERFDGKGYPDGEKGGWIGDKIPVDVQILSVADSFDAMTSKRIYKTANEVRTIEDAVEELKKCSGAHFSPIVVNCFLSAYEAGKVKALKDELDATQPTQALLSPESLGKMVLPELVQYERLRPQNV